MGIYYCLKAKFHIFNFVEDDIHKVITSYADAILLWHGVLPKKLLRIDVKTSHLSQFINKKMKKFFIYPNEELSKNILDRFPQNKYELLISNIPRNLIFSKNHYKNIDDFGKPSSSFTVCSFWFAYSLYKIGEKEKSKKYFDELLSYSNHLGLFSEDLDFKSKRLLGNFPQAYSHLALIETAMNFN